MRHSALAVVLAALLTTTALQPAVAQPHEAQQAPSAKPYPGTIALHVDATDLDRRVFRIRQTMPVAPGALRLYFPRWIPGHHSPTGDVALLAGLQISANGQRVPWLRDPLDTHAFTLTVPAGTRELAIEFQHVSAVAEASGRVVMTRELVNVQWNNLLLYPAGHAARAVNFKPSLTLPAGWMWADALRADKSDGDTVHFNPVTLETLVDSPLFAGKHHKRTELDAAGAARPVVLHLFADSASQLEASDAQLDAHRRLVQQSDKLFGSRHFAKYDLLLALSERLSGIGLEHHESSENAVKPTYFKDWDESVRSRDLLPHEYVHSWNGKFRRPRDLWTPHFNLPMQNSLLWLYEGQTEYWGFVLAARSGLVADELARDELATIAAVYAHRAGRVWRNLQDTTNEPIVSLRRRDKDWRSWQRGADYYSEATLIWLDADTLIREKTGGARSLDDFARAFFGGRDGELEPLAYSFDDIVAALNTVTAHDWARFLRERLDSTAAAAPLDGLARAGWRLAYTDTPSKNQETQESDDKATDFTWSLGLRVGEGGKLSGVIWDSPAFKAGVSPAATLLAVNLNAYKPEVLKDAIKANREGQAPIELLLRDGDRFFSTRIDYRDGLRYPKLERLPSGEDALSRVLAPR